jgi:hypothetical protein
MAAQEDVVLDLNMPQDMDAHEEASQEMEAQKGGVLDLHMIPQEMDTRE